MNVYVNFYSDILIFFKAKVLQVFFLTVLMILLSHINKVFKSDYLV